MIRCTQSLHLASVFLECDFAIAVLAVMADVWRAVTDVGTNNAEEGSKEERRSVDTVLVRQVLWVARQGLLLCHSRRRLLDLGLGLSLAEWAVDRVGLVLKQMKRSDCRTGRAHGGLLLHRNRHRLLSGILLLLRMGRVLQNWRRLCSVVHGARRLGGDSRAGWGRTRLGARLRRMVLER